VAQHNTHLTRIYHFPAIEKPTFEHDQQMNSDSDSDSSEEPGSPSKQSEASPIFKKDYSIKQQNLADIENSMKQPFRLQKLSRKITLESEDLLQTWE